MLTLLYDDLYYTTLVRTLEFIFRSAVVSSNPHCEIDPQKGK